MAGKERFPLRRLWASESKVWLGQCQTFQRSLNTKPWGNRCPSIYIFLLYYIILYYIILYHIISYYIMVCYIILYYIYIILYHIISYHIMHTYVTYIHAHIVYVYIYTHVWCLFTTESPRQPVRQTRRQTSKSDLPALQLEHNELCKRLVQNRQILIYSYLTRIIGQFILIRKCEKNGTGRCLFWIIGVPIQNDGYISNTKQRTKVMRLGHRQSAWMLIDQFIVARLSTSTSTMELSPGKGESPKQQGFRLLTSLYWKLDQIEVTYSVHLTVIWIDFCRFSCLRFGPYSKLEQQASASARQTRFGRCLFIGHLIASAGSIFMEG